MSSRPTVWEVLPSPTLDGRFDITGRLVSYDLDSLDALMTLTGGFEEGDEIIICGFHIDSTLSRDAMLDEARALIEEEVGEPVY